MHKSLWFLRVLQQICVRGCQAEISTQIQKITQSGSCDKRLRPWTASVQQRAVGHVEYRGFVVEKTLILVSTC